MKNKLKIAVAAGFAAIHLLTLSTYLISYILFKAGIETHRLVGFSLIIIPYVFITLIQIALSAVKKYNIAQIISIAILAVIKAVLMIALEMGLWTNPSLIFTAPYGVCLAYIILCGLLCIAEIVVPIAVYVKNRIAPELKAKTA